MKTNQAVIRIWNFENPNDTQVFCVPVDLVEIIIDAIEEHTDYCASWE